MTSRKLVSDEQSMIDLGIRYGVLCKRIKAGTVGLQYALDGMQILLEGQQIQVVPKEPVVLGTAVTQVEALKILGPKKMITIEQACKAWGIEFVTDVPILFSLATLKKCARENKKRTHSWRLVPIVLPDSLRELRERVGIDIKQLPCFYDNDWWFGKSEGFWVQQQATISWQLMDFGTNDEGNFAHKKWQPQEDEIAKRPEDERACEIMLTQVVLTIFKVTGLRLLPNWYHWGRCVASVGYRMNVGGFGNGSWNVDGVAPGGYYGCLRVVLSKKLST